jgi:hypothetical protein
VPVLAALALRRKKRVATPHSHATAPAMSFRSSRVPLAPRPSPVAATPLHFSPAKSGRAASRAARPTPSPALSAHPRASTPVPTAAHTHSWGSSPVKWQAGASADRKTRDRWQKGGREQGGPGGPGSSDEGEDSITSLVIDDEFRESGGTVSRGPGGTRVCCVTRVHCSCSGWHSSACGTSCAKTMPVRDDKDADGGGGCRVVARRV